MAAPATTWLTLLFLLGLHLLMNRAAVRSVSMRSLNRQRASIVFAQLLAYGRLPSPREVAQKERIFERNGVLRWVDDRVVGYGRISVNLETLLARATGGSHRHPRSVNLEATKRLSGLLDIFGKERYILWFDQTTSTAYITLKEGATVRTQLKSWLHALVLAQSSAERTKASAATPKSSEELTETLERVSQVFAENESRLISAGWDLEIAALETQPGTRVKVQRSN